MASLLHVPHVLLAFLPLVSGAMNAGVSHASDPRVAAILRRKASVEGLRWQNALPPSNAKLAESVNYKVSQPQFLMARVPPATATTTNARCTRRASLSEGSSFNVAGQDDDEQAFSCLRACLVCSA